MPEELINQNKLIFSLYLYFVIIYFQPFIKKVYYYPSCLLNK